MSKIIEYLKLIPRGLQNMDKIIEGIVNETKLRYNILPEHSQDEIIRRKIICNTCPLNSINAKTSNEYKALYNTNYVSDRIDLHCSVCGCNEDFKTSSLNSDCGLEYYNYQHPENIQELKFTKYIKK